MDESRQREIASKGGRAAHAKGTAHEFDSNEARAAGRKGGEAVSRNREHMAAIGRKGGEARGTSARNGAGRVTAARSGGESMRGEVLRGSASETVSGTADTYRSTGGRADSTRTPSPRLGEQDRTQQLRADEFPADQGRSSATRDHAIGGSNTTDISRDAGAR